MSNSILLFANIKIPIQVFHDGSIHTFENNTDIEFTECESLPEPNNNNNSYFMRRLMNFVGKNKENKHENISLTEEQLKSPIIEQKHYTVSEEKTEYVPETEAKMMLLKKDIKTTYTRPINSSFKKRQFKHRNTAKHN
jgi:hypothetical protein